MDYRIKQLPPIFQLTSEYGPPVTVSRIGKGRYCTAYRQLDAPEIVYLRVKDSDNSKAILEDCEGPHIPQLERIGMIGDDYLWKTRHYQRLTAKHKEAWKQYRALAKAREEAYTRIALPSIRDRSTYARNSWGHDVMQAVTDAFDGPLGDALQQITDSAANYGSTYVFEFAPRNLAVDDTGQLILLDPVFDVDEIDRAMAAKRKGGAYVPYY